jgi:hypothetical protein
MMNRSTINSNPWAIFPVSIGAPLSNLGASMAEQSGNLFSLSTQRRGEWAHGKALAHGSYRAVASLHRGINLSASVDMEAQLSGEARKVAVAAFSVGGRLSAGLSLQAAFPIDLFREAGMVARFQAQLEAAAWVAAEIGLDLQALLGLIGKRASKPWLSLMNVFLNEFDIRAGVWGKASFSAQVFAEAAIVGHLIPLEAHRRVSRCRLKRTRGSNGAPEWCSSSTLGLKTETVPDSWTDWRIN